ncbi:hypothetical protein AB9P05_00445 [Roseivirga sp. BDSF3-8]|uniref:hypothetical protein n=1 Tax=Roseivirga sp. BDSF3-8 TaxID=3241598 RepID=UPI0035320895
MKKTKLSLSALQVSSFTTAPKEIKGGATYQSDASYCKDSGCAMCDPMSEDGCWQTYDFDNCPETSLQSC